VILDQDNGSARILPHLSGNARAPAGAAQADRGKALHGSIFGSGAEADLVDSDDSALVEND